MMDLYSESKRYNDLMQNYKNILNRMKYFLTFTEIHEDITCHKHNSQEELNLITNELLELKSKYLSDNSSNSEENKIDKSKNTIKLQNTTYKLDRMNIKTQVNNKNIDEREDINTELKKLDEIVKPNNETRQKSKYSLLKNCSEIMVKPKDKKLKRRRSWETDMLPYNASFMSLALSRNELPEVESKVADLCESNSQTHHEKYHVLKSVFLREKVKNLNIENYSTCFSPVCWTRNLNCHKINSTLNSSLTSKRSKPNLKYLKKHCPYGLGPTNFIAMPLNIFCRKKCENEERHSKKTYRNVSCNTNKIKYRQISKSTASDLSDTACPYKTSNESLPFEALEYKVQKLPKPTPTKNNRERTESSNSHNKKKWSNKYIYEPSISSLPPDEDVIVSGCKKKRNIKHLSNEDYIAYIANAKCNTIKKPVEENDDEDTDDDSDSANEYSDSNSDASTIKCTETNSPNQNEKAYRCQTSRDCGRNTDEIGDKKGCRRELKEQDSDDEATDSECGTLNSDSYTSEEEAELDEIEEIKKQGRKPKHQTDHSAYPCTNKYAQPHLMVPLTPDSDMSDNRSDITPETRSERKSERKSKRRSEDKSFESSSIMDPITETPDSDSCKSTKCTKKTGKQCKKYAKPSLMVPLTPSSYTPTPSFTPSPSTVSERYEASERYEDSSSLMVPLSITPDCETCHECVERSITPPKPSKRTGSPWQKRDKYTKTNRPPPTPDEEEMSSDDSSDNVCLSAQCSECAKPITPRKHSSTNTKPLPVIRECSTNTGGTESRTDNSHAWALAYVKLHDDGAKLVQILHTTRQAPGRYLLKEPNELILFGPQAKNK